jgi:hypothetical protein
MLALPGHTSGRDTLASSGSCHRTKTAVFHRELELILSPVGSPPNVDDLPPSLHGHYPASPLLRSSPPLPDASVLSASRVHRLCVFPWHRRPGSQVPYESPNESHASYTPGIAWPVGRFPPRSSWSKRAAPVLMPSEELSMRHRRFRGRNGHCWSPPAQIRASPIRALGSYLGCVTAKRTEGQG